MLSIEPLRITASASSDVGAPASNAPMSTPAPEGRRKPRWSVGGAPIAVPKSIAGLPGSHAIVKVGPLLSASPSSFGSVKLKLDPLLKLHEPSELILKPSSVMVPEALLYTPVATSLLKLRPKA